MVRVSLLGHIRRTISKAYPKRLRAEQMSSSYTWYWLSVARSRFGTWSVTLFGKCQSRASDYHRTHWWMHIHASNMDGRVFYRTSESGSPGVWGTIEYMLGLTQWHELIQGLGLPNVQSECRWVAARRLLQHNYPSVSVGSALHCAVPYPGMLSCVRIHVSV